MFALWVIGREVETVLGRALFVAVYGVSLSAAAAVMLFSDPAGATARLPARCLDSWGAVRAAAPCRGCRRQVIGVIALNVVISLTPSPDLRQGHLGNLRVRRRHGRAVSPRRGSAQNRRQIPDRRGHCRRRRGPDADRCRGHADLTHAHPFPRAAPTRSRAAPMPTCRTGSPVATRPDPGGAR
ncbi:hypothetical protein HBB16_21385 [Pseudonocardia sp. MCCB 268]|nr:hypothetical protein [Pseudonocardia cytotoxica]